MLAVLLCLLPVDPATAAPEVAGAAEAADAAGVSLFDGTLDRWAEAGYGGQGLVEAVPAAEVDGSDVPVLRIGSGDPLTGVMYTGPFDPKSDETDTETATETDTERLPRMNYVFTWQARRVLGGDFFSTVLFPVGDDVCSVVVGGWGGGVIGLSSLDGMDASENITTNFRLFTNDEWSDFRLTVKPDSVILAIDGEDMFEVDPSEYAVTTRLEMEPLGSMGIASYQSTGELRNLRVTRIAGE